MESLRSKLKMCQFEYSLNTVESKGNTNISTFPGVPENRIFEWKGPSDDLPYYQ